MQDFAGTVMQNFTNWNTPKNDSDPGFGIC